MTLSKRSRRWIIFVVGVIPWIAGACLGSEAWGRFFGTVFAIYALFRLFPRDYSHWRSDVGSGAYASQSDYSSYTPFDSSNFVYTQPLTCVEDVYTGIGDMGTVDFTPVEDFASYSSHDDLYTDNSMGGPNDYDAWDGTYNFDSDPS